MRAVEADDQRMGRLMIRGWGGGLEDVSGGLEATARPRRARLRRLTYPALPRHATSRSRARFYMGTTRAERVILIGATL